MSLVMMLMHAYGRFVHRPEPPAQTRTYVVFVAPQEASRTSAEAAIATPTR